MNIYYKIYKLYQRNIPVQQISATTHIPIKTIKDLVARFEAKGVIKDESEIEKIVDPFLDYAISRYHKYVVVDFYGMLIESFAEKIKEALEEAKQMQGQVLAVKLDSITEIDDASVELILEFKKRVSRASGKSVVFLSPNDLAEEYIQENNIEEKIKIFGTQSSFEEYIFKHVIGITTRVPRVK
jgi:ABC-type transporter Mla MlaB component